MQQDPLVAAITTVFEQVVQRGIEVRPMGDGFYVRIASQEVADSMQQQTLGQPNQGRSW